MQDIGIIDAEKSICDVLDELVSRGALQPRNRMDIECLLNPVQESHTITETMDEELYEAVMDARKE
jgi:hypothetical protein